MFTSRPLRVGVLAHYYPPHVGGLEVVAREVANGLTRRGHEVTVVTSACPGAPGAMDEDGVTVRRVRVGNWFERHGVPFPVFAPSLLLHTWRLVRRSDVVQVHDMLYLSSWVGALLCRVLRRPYVVTQHVGMVDHPARVVRLVQGVVLHTVGALVLRGAACVLPISPVIDAWTRGALPGVRTQVLRNGLDRARFRPAVGREREEIRRRFGLPLGEVLVLHVGRFVPKKGFDVVAAAVGEGYRTVFVGGDRPVDLPESSARLFLGTLPPDDVAAVYRACDVFVCASRGEGPLTPMEALLSGCAVLVNDDPAMRALGLGDGVEELAMTPARLRAALVDLIDRPGAVAELAARGRVVAAGLPTWEEHLDALETVLESVRRAVPSEAGR
ncbi:glycosyltransferase family 4 protein [Nocardioides massiliensis]|uniref:Glycosyltransferase involved in cell wall biosynthesis n=1 Tax=Nocardioides massiliensis TaxID=1325935 RepID=A0ABT9NPG4_9ACTN|nr:glycosyltransferase family 4 protein [Nocardioides massiliensis]MDP9821750.1 glycosyltransferase involved in cell wall biosynthesis [Nocardioides massiliensis]